MNDLIQFSEWLLKPLINFYLRMFYFQLSVAQFNYPSDEIIDKLLQTALQSGIESVTVSDSGYTISFKFNDGGQLVSWNSNKYYAWLSEGYYGKGNFKYSYRSARPKVYTMYLLHQAMLKYFEQV